MHIFSSSPFTSNLGGGLQVLIHKIIHKKMFNLHLIDEEITRYNF